jgi:hypothetical protein
MELAGNDPAFPKRLERSNQGDTLSRPYVNILPIFYHYNVFM